MPAKNQSRVSLFKSEPEEENSVFDALLNDSDSDDLDVDYMEDEEDVSVSDTVLLDLIPEEYIPEEDNL